MPLKILYLLHVLPAVIWVGGMFFAHQVLRPVAAAQLQPPQRLPLWNGVFGRFFPWVWASVALLFLSGQGMVLMLGGMAALPVHGHVMAGIGYLMIGLFIYLYFLPYAAFKRAVAAEDWPAAGAILNRIRHIVGVNLSLGLINIVLVFSLPALL